MITGELRLLNADVLIVMDPKKHLYKDRKFKAAPKMVGEARTQFGTRLCSRVLCEKCGKVDYVSLRISEQKQQFCRDCAEKILATYDQGRIIQEKHVKCVCEKCRRHFFVALALTKKKEQLLCLDCMRGFDVWRGKANISGPRAHHSILTKIGSRTTFRKNTDDTI